MAEHPDHGSLPALAAAARTGDRAALTELITQTSPTVWRVCAALVDVASADDLTQDTYVRAIGALQRFRGDASPLSWLIAIARRVCADEIAGRQRRRRLADRLQIHRRADSGEPLPTVALSVALAQLPRDRLEAFLLTAVAGFSYAEAAAVFDCPVGTIRSRVSRARSDLHRALSDEPGFGGRLTG
ncbi:sigma-70 family RNA polymerase sigma factor [Plantactinospora sp. KBS50]|uniref:sigma-70 family RNA polymerase sigma factor n=1 Tax=Plantactinospora sp. KBS50 TaxID=2024580 RepID=UPI000BAAC036|nr:sigma-70 family RNA polymerase sigma factor [Plantactinospora sp. KBS50]ASW53418.1 hypothetical protein CIK06_03285 [Plantactinospora sp. KBS50]